MHGDGPTKSSCYPQADRKMKIVLWAKIKKPEHGVGPAAVKKMSRCTAIKIKECTDVARPASNQKHDEAPKPGASDAVQAPVDVTRTEAATARNKHHPAAAQPLARVAVVVTGEGQH